MANREPAKVVKETFAPDGKTKTATLYSDGTIMIYGVRGSYMHIDKPYKGKNDKPEAVAKYSMVSLLPKTTHGTAKDLVKEEIAKVLKQQGLEDLASDRKFLRNGDQAGKVEYKGMFTVNSREERQPHVRDRTGKKVEQASIRSTFQSGYWFNVLIRPWWQDPKGGYGARVNAGLSAVQFVRQDETFGEGGIDDEEVDARFGSIDDDDAGFGGNSGGDLDDL